MYIRRSSSWLSIYPIRYGLFQPRFLYETAEKSDLDIVVAGTHDSVIMVEAGCKFVTEEDIMNAVEFAQGEIRKQCDNQVAFAKECGVEKQEFVNVYFKYQTFGHLRQQ